MKTITLTLFAAAIGLAQSSSSTSTTTVDQTKPAQTSKSSTQSKSTAQKPAQQVKPPAKAEGPVTAVPAGAKLVEPNLYRYTDAGGKTWLYRQTPFGISKSEDTGVSGAEPAPQSAPQSNAKGEAVAVTDLGDSYRFEKKTPFGQTTWTRKKSELSDEEKAITSDQQAISNSNSVPSGAQNKPAGN
jgi:hypothetical protein